MTKTYTILRDPNPEDKGGDKPPVVPPVPGIDPEVHKAAIEKARLEEREKVRKELEASQLAATEAAKLKEKLAADQQKLDAQIAALGAAKPGETTDIKKVITEVTDRMQENHNRLLEAERTANTKNTEALTQRLNQMELNATKQRLVDEAGGPSKLVMSLVRGSTEDELRASIKTAADTYAEIESKTLRDAGVVDNEGKPVTTLSNGKAGVRPPPSLNPAGGDGVGRRADDTQLVAGVKVRELSADEYKKKRGEILADLKRRTS